MDKRVTSLTWGSGRSTPSDKAGGGRGHPDPEIRGGPVSKIFFSAHRASIWSKNKREGSGSPWPLPWITHYGVPHHHVNRPLIAV